MNTISSTASTVWMSTSRKSVDDSVVSHTVADDELKVIDVAVCPSVSHNIQCHSQQHQSNADGGVKYTTKTDMNDDDDDDDDCGHYVPSDMFKAHVPMTTGDSLPVPTSVVGLSKTGPTTLGSYDQVGRSASSDSMGSVLTHRKSHYSEQHRGSNGGHVLYGDGVSQVGGTSEDEQLTYEGLQSSQYR